MKQGLKVGLFALCVLFSATTAVFAHEGEKDCKECKPAKTATVTAAALRKQPGALVLSVKGMTCEGCASSVKSELAKVSGVKRVAIDVKTQTAVVVGGKPSTPALKAAVKKAGFTLLAVKKG